MKLILSTNDWAMFQYFASRHRRSPILYLAEEPTAYSLVFAGRLIPFRIKCNLDEKIKKHQK